MKPYETESGTYLDFDLDDAIEQELPYPGQQRKEPQPRNPRAEEQFRRRNTPLDPYEDPGIANDISDVRRLLKNPKDRYIRELFDKGGVVGKADDFIRKMRGVDPDMPFRDLSQTIRQRMGFDRHEPVLSDAIIEMESRDADPGGYMKSVNPDRRDKQLMQSYPQRPARPEPDNPGLTDEELLEIIQKGM